IGMVESRGRLRLALEAGQDLCVLGDVIGQKLEGDKAVERNVFGLVNDAHTAAPEFLDNAVVRDGLADHQQTRGFRVASSYGCGSGPSMNDGSDTAELEVQRAHLSLGCPRRWPPIGIAIRDRTELHTNGRPTGSRELRTSDRCFYLGADLLLCGIQYSG